MVKFLAKGAKGGLLIGLGITDANIEQLKLGRPIRVNIAEVAQEAGVVMQGTIAIMWGKDEFAIEKELRDTGLLTPQTKIINDPALEALRPKPAKSPKTKPPSRRKR